MSNQNESDIKDGSPDKSIKSPHKKGYIPYNTIYKSQDEVRKVGYWIPGIPVHAQIVEVEKDHGANLHILNPFVYTIELRHGKYVWRVIRKYKDFSYLSNRLITHRAMERIKAPVRRAKSKIEDAIDGDDEEPDSNKDYELQILAKVKDMSDFGLPTATGNGDSGSPKNGEDIPDNPQDVALPSFPLIPDAMVSETHMNERRERLEHWLQCVLSIPVNRDYHETAEFLEISRYSFINELGGKYKESEVRKRPGGNKVYIGCKNFCVRFILPWGTRWLIVKDTYVCYMNPSNERIRLVLLFDDQFEIDSMELGINIKPKVLLLSNLQHVLAMKCKREEEAHYWKQTIRGVLDTTGSVWLRKKRFGSSFPIRPNSYVQWFVDAKDYWEKAAAMIEIAREEIFIADWWLCPEVYMKRPMAEGNHWRLGEILQRQAKRGVRIFILIYKEMEMALTLNSTYSKKYLQDLHPNIKVMRHPDHYFGTGTFFWAHHEKLLVIDQLIAFVGGLDLCYGRWDDSKHRLTDLGSVQFAPKSEGITQMSTLTEAMDELAAKECGEKRDERSEKEPTDETDKAAQIHEIKEDIIDEETGKKIGERTTRTVKPSETRQKFRDIMSKAVRMNKSPTESPKPKRAVSAAPRQSSRSPTPFDNVTTSERSPSAHRKIDLSDIFDPHRNRPRQLVHSLGPFGPVKGFKFRNVTAGVDPTTPVDEPSPSKDRSMDFSRETVGSSKERLRMEPHNRTLMRRVVSNLKSNRSRRRWQMLLDKDKNDDAAAEYVINYCKVQETEVDVSGLVGAGKLWPGKDYVNYMVKDFVDVHEAYSDFINRYEIPRTPWHDIHSLVYGEAARDVARHFIQRWNATKTEKLKDDSSYPYLLPKCYDSASIRVPKVFINANTHCADVQVLRSVSHWSTLIDRTEDSIQQAYLSLIANAEHYVYIENQFFVSMINSSEVVNEVCRVICDRITRAHRDNETFRVIIIIPLLPGFEGKINSTDYSALLAVLHWTMLSISNGPHSLLENLKRNGVDDPWKYLSFNSLRTWDELGDKLVTEQIYVHCKLMIVDDRFAIIGSANINDRSQCGNRDSEVCLLVEDREFIPSTMNGKPYEAGKFASSLRKRCMGEHLGINDDVLHKAKFSPPVSLDDPVSDSFFIDVWQNTANHNTRIYEEVFRCYPTNLVTSYDELQAWQVEVPMTQYDEGAAREQLAQLRGSLVIFPENFLKTENLSPTITSKEGLVPSAVFT